MYLDHTADNGPPEGLRRKRAGDWSNCADSVKGLSWGGDVIGGGGGDDVDADDVAVDDVDDDTTSFFFSFGEQSGAYTRKSYPPHSPVIPVEANQDDPGKA